MIPSATTLALSTLLLSALAAPAPILRQNFPRSTAEWDLENVVLAAVRAAPVNWPSPLLNKNWTDISLDLNRTVSYGVELIEAAAANGARLIAL